MVSGLKEVLSLHVIGTSRAHGGEGGADLTLGEELRRREGRLAVGLLGGGGARLHPGNRGRIATDTVGAAHIGALLGHGARNTQPTKLLGLVQEGRLGPGIGIKKNVESNNAGEHKAQANHLRLRQLHVYIKKQTNFNDETYSHPLHQRSGATKNSRRATDD